MIKTIKNIFVRMFGKKKKEDLHSDIIPLGVHHTVCPKDYPERFVVNDMDKISNNITFI